MIRHRYVPAACRICGSDPVHDAQWVKCTNPLCNLSQHKTHVVSWPRKAVIDWRATLADIPTDLSRTVAALKARADRWYTRNEMKLLYWTREALGGLLFVLCLAVWILALMLTGCARVDDNKVVSCTTEQVVVAEKIAAMCMGDDSSLFSKQTCTDFAIKQACSFAVREENVPR